MNHFCTNCGNPLHGENFCTNCGQKVENSSSPSQQNNPQNPFPMPETKINVISSSSKPSRHTFSNVILILFLAGGLIGILFLIPLIIDFFKAVF